MNHAQSLEEIPKQWCAYCGKSEHHQSGYCPEDLASDLDLSHSDIAIERIAKKINAAFCFGYLQAKQDLEVKVE